VINDGFSNTPGVYKLVNLVNGKVYIGSTTKLRQRRFSHLSKLRNGKHENRNIQNDWNEYGENNFNWEVIQIIDDISDTFSLIPREQYWMNFYRSYDRESGYNISPTAGKTTGISPSLELRQKHSEFMRNHKHTPESYKKAADTRRGKKNIKPMRPDRGKEISAMNTGEGNGRATLSSEDVVGIIHLLGSTSLTARQIGAMFNTTKDAVLNIKHSRAWRHITEKLQYEYPFLQRWLKSA